MLTSPYYITKYDGGVEQTCQLTGSEVAPLGQFVQLLAPDAEKVFTWQGEHDAASAELKVPAEQGVHLSPSMN